MKIRWSEIGTRSERNDKALNAFTRLLRSGTFSAVNAGFITRLKFGAVFLKANTITGVDKVLLPSG